MKVPPSEIKNGSSLMKDEYVLMINNNATISSTNVPYPESLVKNAPYPESLAKNAPFVPTNAVPQQDVISN